VVELQRGHRRLGRGRRSVCEQRAQARREEWAERVEEGGGEGAPRPAVCSSVR
jgi:hypothetical protein